MPNPGLAVAGLGAGTSLIGASQQAKAAGRAADAQTQAAEAGIAEQRRQFDAVQALLAPFVEGGTDAFRSMLDLAGVGGPDAEQAAIAAIEAGPQFEELTRQGEEAILARASATGGLRGGDVQGALAQFRPQVLIDLVSQRYGQLGGLAGLGQASASGQAAAAQNLGANVSNLLGQVGAAQAGGALARGQAFQQGLAGIGQGIGLIGGQVQMPTDSTIFGRWGF